MWGNIIIAFALAVLASFVITPYTIRLAKKIGAIDRPEGRKVHTKETPRLGGIAVVLAFLISVIYIVMLVGIGEPDVLFKSDEFSSLIGFIIAGIILSCVCFIDDWKDIKPVFKLLAQVVAAIIICASGIRIEQIVLPFLTVEANVIVSYMITIGWIIIVTNAINLIDGLDGLSCGVSFVACISLIVVFSLHGSTIISIILITALAGAILGFIPYNFNPARTFIGDVGSNFLGFSLAVISILGTAKTYTALVLVAPILVLALPLFDTIFAIIRRLIKGKSLKAVFKADRGHLHHRLVDRGFSQKHSVMILYGISLAIGIFTIILIESGIWNALSFALIVIALAGAGYKDILKLKKEK